MAGNLTSTQSLVVEFVGLPGVGKSHATRLVAARLAAVGTPARSSALRINHELGRSRRVLHKSAICAVEALGHPRRAASVAHALTESDQQSRVDVLRLLYNWLFLVGLLRRARTRPVVELLDEGIYQLLWSIGFGGGERVIRDHSSAFLKQTPMPDVVVVVEAPPELIQSRFASRGSRAGRIDRMEEAERQAALVRGADLLNELLSGLDGKGAGPLLRRVRNSGSDQLGADVSALVEELASLV